MEKCLQTTKSFHFWFYSDTSKFGPNQTIGYGYTKFVKKYDQVLWCIFIQKTKKSTPDAFDALKMGGIYRAFSTFQLVD